ncbi:unnamed protein product [Blumeria hordei]|uniref:Mannose-6-phosphate isomerase n=2 Tax=Blumeria hordei TaxID=2867405 RepID=A0A383UQY7_BLUHO|nr:pmi40 mannose 6 phosphate isomerase [Blumeria hordei DH14]SZF02731.1 unnamed protein product [Blumeria hordei]
MQNHLIRLQCGLNSYDWGKIGRNSAAARLAAATPTSDFVIEDIPYAELWIGTHPSNPSKDVQTKRTLLELIQEDHNLISTNICERFGNKLPFLLKVLSIEKALSIQAHPNKKLAEQLHQKDGKNYPDNNHKPEMTIAITYFEGLCGFRPLIEILHFLNTVNPLQNLVGGSNVQEFKDTIESIQVSENADNERAVKDGLRKIFNCLMQSKPDKIISASKALLNEARDLGPTFAGGGGPSNTGEEMAQLVMRLSQQYPDDIGLFVLFFLNYVKLEPGEALFLGADEIHAYLSGDVIECMAASDNVIRAGFTPKFKDTDTLVSMLTYSCAPIEKQKMQPVDYPYVTLNSKAYSSGSYVTLYDPPIDEFSVVKTELKNKASKATFEQISGPSVLICTSGNGRIVANSSVEDVHAGYVYFVGANTGVILESDDTEFTTFRAFCELPLPQNSNL